MRCPVPGPDGFTRSSPIPRPASGGPRSSDFEIPASRSSTPGARASPARGEHRPRLHEAGAPPRPRPGGSIPRGTTRPPSRWPLPCLPGARAESEAELEVFLANHQVHRLAGGEGAYPVGVYREALVQGGLRVRRVWGPLDSAINAFPLVNARRSWSSSAGGWSVRDLGRLRPSKAERLPIVGAGVASRIAPYVPPGSMWSFLAARD